MGEWGVVQSSDDHGSPARSDVRRRDTHGVSAPGRDTAGDILEQLPVIAYRCRADEIWTCQYVGSDIARFGFDPRRWTSDPGLWLRQIHPDDRDRVARERLLAPQTGWLTTEYRLRTASGDERWIHDRARVVGPSAGERRAQAHGVLLDMSEQHRADRAISHSFETATARVDELALATSVEHALLRLYCHDIRTPLSTASGLVATLLDDIADDAGTGRRQGELQHVSHALGLVRRLIDDVDRMWGAGPDAASATVPVELDRLLQDVVDEVGVESSRVDVVCDGVVVPAIEPLLRRALVGLVRNAVVHTPADTHVVISAIPRDDGVVLIVEDDGPGISDRDKDRVFEPFIRLTDDAEIGHGVGLSLIRDVAALHGGEVWIEDVPTGGAAFCLLVPGPPQQRG